MKKGRTIASTRKPMEQHTEVPTSILYFLRVDLVTVFSIY